MDVVFKDLYDAFDTRPNARKNYKKQEIVEEIAEKQSFVQEEEKINAGVS